MKFASFKKDACIRVKTLSIYIIFSRVIDKNNSMEILRVKELGKKTVKVNSLSRKPQGIYKIFLEIVGSARSQDMTDKGKLILFLYTRNECMDTKIKLQCQL